MKLLQLAPFVLIVGAVVYLGATTAPRAPKHNADAVPETRPRLNLLRRGDDMPSATLRIESKDSGSKAVVDLYRDGGIFVRRTEGPATAAPTDETLVAPKYHFELERQAYLLDYQWDIGAWMALRLARRGEESALDVGIRASPGRLLYGVVSPDFLVSPYMAGAGVSLYLPDTVRAGTLNRLGVGAAWLADYHGRTGFAPYVSLSLRF